MKRQETARMPDKHLRPLRSSQIVLALAVTVFGLIVCWGQPSCGQTDVANPPTTSQEHRAALRDQIRQWLTEANRLQKEGDLAQALVLRSRAKALFRSLKVMEESANSGDERSPAAAEPKRRTRTALTQAEAVMALHECIEVLKLLGEPETARPVERVLARIATPGQVRAIVEYYRQQRETESSREGRRDRSGGESRTDGSAGAPEHQPTTDQADEDASTVGKNSPTGKNARSGRANAADPSASSGRSAGRRVSPLTREELENEIAALQIAMQTLLDNDRTRSGRRLAEGIMLRSRALRSGKTEWESPTPDFAAYEIDAVRLAATMMFRDQKMIQARILRDLANRLLQRQRLSGLSASEMREPTITELMQRIQQLEQENRKLKSQLQRHQQRGDEQPHQSDEQRQQPGEQQHQLPGDGDADRQARPDRRAWV